MKFLIAMLLATSVLGVSCTDDPVLEERGEQLEERGEEMQDAAD